MDLHAGTLYIVGTPIGNLEDMTFRAIDVLRKVNVIAAEDTRHTGKLLQHFQIATPQVSYHDHNRRSRHPELLNRLERGETIALVTDAGMPGISDPGYELVKACVEHAIPVVPIPGVSAVITALSASGLPTDRFAFEGFLPAKAQERRQHLETLRTEPRTLIFYESPHRLVKTLSQLAEVFGADRPAAIARELTKKFEEVQRGSLEELAAYYGAQPNVRGELVVVVGGAA